MIIILGYLKTLQGIHCFIKKTVLKKNFNFNKLFFESLEQVVTEKYNLYSELILSKEQFNQSDTYYGYDLNLDKFCFFEKKL